MKNHICNRCNYHWKSKKTENPKSCAKCKSKVWNKLRKYNVLNKETLAKRFKPTGRAAIKFSSLKTKYDYFVLGISGGKDSTALLLWLLYEFKIEPEKLICVFCDTGNEADQLYKHIEKINTELHPIITLTPEFNFFELAKKKKRFPDPQRRFCTEHLKLKPLKQYLETLTGRILNLNGMRSEESLRRAGYKEFAGVFETYTGVDEWRPILRWKIEDVFLIHKRYNFPLNPLYSLGFERVGCMPCIMQTKKEVQLLAKHFPEKIDLIREVENSFPNRNNFYQFFPLNKTPDKFKSKTVFNQKGEPLQLATIDDVINWSKSNNKSNKQLSEETQCKVGICE